MSQRVESRGRYYKSPLLEQKLRTAIWAVSRNASDCLESFRSRHYMESSCSEVSRHPLRGLQTMTMTGYAVLEAFSYDHPISPYNFTQNRVCLFP